MNLFSRTIIKTTVVLLGLSAPLWAVPADYVFSGAIIDPGSVAPDRATVAVDRCWRGSLPARVIVNLQSPLSFRPATTYLFFATSRVGELWVFDHSGSAPREAAGDAIARLGDGSPASAALPASSVPVPWSDPQSVSILTLSDGYEMRSQADDLRMYKRRRFIEQLIWRIHGSDIPVTPKECEQENCPAAVRPQFLAFDPPRRAVYYYAALGTAQNDPLAIFRSRLPDGRPERLASGYGAGYDVGVVSPGGRYVAFRQWTHRGGVCHSLATPDALDTSRKVLLRIAAKRSTKSPSFASAAEVAWQSDHILSVRYIDQNSDCTEVTTAHSTQLIDVRQATPISQKAR
ncbi:MAG TPA: hypothetical protein VMU17_07460 [Elusimicrobiota bacterium]|nr:hypothetical protein [Elusimicrobiota bacterium]